MSKAVILGVTGQDGSLLADFLLDKGYEVYGVARRTSTPNTRNIEHLSDNNKFQLVSGDITDYSSMREIFGKVRPNEIYHLAAQSHVGESFKQPLTTWDITGKGVLNVLEAVRQSNIYPKLVFAASSEMFGNNRRADNYIDEKTPFSPQSPYAIAKVAGYYATKLYREYGLFCCNCIAFNHESHRRGENFVTRKITKYIGKNYSVIKSGMDVKEKLKLGNLGAFRDWTYAGDVIRGMWMMLQHSEPDDYVLASGRTHSVQDFLDEAFDILGVRPDEISRYVEIDPSLFRPAEVHHLLGDSSHATRKLGWTPSVSFENLVINMVHADKERNGQT